MLSPGDVVAGKYRIERPLGEGGMGAVFVAVNEKLRKRVALKLLRREVANVPGASERFTREAIAASSAKHPGIIEIYDADAHEGLPWIAMELLDGESLAARMERGRVPLDEVLEIACQALAALAHVHRAGIIHRDLKPDNLFLEQLPEGGWRLKILDFGIAASSGPELARVTQTGMAIGTPAYLAPEQAAGQSDLDGRVDVYAMGVILFELITGRLPYAAHSVGEMVMLMYTKGPPSLATEAPWVPPSLGALVDMCLAIDRAHRVQSAETLRRELESLRPVVRGLSPPGAHGAAAAGSATPIGHPDFAASLPRTHTPQELAYAATAYAPATPAQSVPGTSYSPAPSTPGAMPYVPGPGSAPPPAHASPPPALASHPPYAAPPPHREVAPARSRGPAALLALLLVLAAMVVGVVGTAVLFFYLGGEDEVVVTASASRSPHAPSELTPPVPPTPVLSPMVPGPAPEPEPTPEPTPSEAAEEAEPAPEPEPTARAPRRVRRLEPQRAPEPPPQPPVAEAARPLDNATIVRVLEANEARLDRCYFDEYPERPRPRVRTEVDLSIGRDGRVTDSRVVSGRPLLDACVRRVLSGVRFPSHAWPTRARFPMTFVDER